MTRLPRRADATGVDRGVCAIIGNTGIVCTVEVQLSNGTLSAQGLLPQTAHNTPLAITGRTGAYDGARGTAVVNARSRPWPQPEPGSTRPDS
jgi:hypothetical protein